MDSWYTIVIPTRDSEAWIGPLLEHYLQRGVTPLIFLDSRTQDGTRAIVDKAGVPIVEMAPFPFTECIVARTRDAVKTPWTLFVNDDEVPSEALFTRLKGPQPPASVQSVAIPRRWAWHEADKRLRYARTNVWQDRTGEHGSDHHWRLFRQDQVTFIAKMHTDGFLIDQWSRVPSDCYIVHFEWVLRTKAEREAKLRRYDRHRFGYGLFFANMYLPEKQPPGVIEYLPFETGAYDILAKTYFDARRYNLSSSRPTLDDRLAHLKHKLRTLFAGHGLGKEPEDRSGLTPRLDAEIIDPYSAPRKADEHL